MCVDGEEEVLWSCIVYCVFFVFYDLMGVMCSVIVCFVGKLTSDWMFKSCVLCSFLCKGLVFVDCVGYVVFEGCIEGIVIVVIVEGEMDVFVWSMSSVC